MENMDPNYMGEDIYRENILDHFKNPHNEGKLETKHQHKEFNPTCGDEITMYLQIEDNKITDIKFSGKGCAISMASSSMLTDKIKNKTIQEIQSITDEDIKEMLGIDLGIVRLKCALLPLKAAIKALGEKNGTNN